MGLPTPLPPDMGEHSRTIAGWLAGAALSLSALVALLLRQREKEKESQVAEALREVKEEIKTFGADFKETITRIFDKIDGIEKENKQRDIRCAALHGKVPGWDGFTERRTHPPYTSRTGGEAG